MSSFSVTFLPHNLKVRQGKGQRHGFVQGKPRIAAVAVGQQFGMDHPATGDLRPMFMKLGQISPRPRTG